MMLRFGLSKENGSVNKRDESIQPDWFPLLTATFLKHSLGILHCSLKIKVSMCPLFLDLFEIVFVAN
jgi:hypothetical protein